MARTSLFLRDLRSRWGCPAETGQESARWFNARVRPVMAARCDSIRAASRYEIGDDEVDPSFPISGGPERHDIHGTSTPKLDSDPLGSPLFSLS